MVYDSLVDSVRPGDRVTVTGIFRTNPVRVNSRQRSVKSLFRTFLDVVHISKSVDGGKNSARNSSEEVTEADFNTSANDTVMEEERRDIERKVEEISQLPELYEKLAASLGKLVVGDLRLLCCNIFII
jgi:DNA replication licensing factor MCM4